jgi:hypothetical protein
MPCLSALQKSCAWCHNQVVGNFCTKWRKKPVPHILQHSLPLGYGTMHKISVCAFITKTRHEDL